MTKQRPIFITKLHKLLVRAWVAVRLSLILFKVKCMLRFLPLKMYYNRYFVTSTLSEDDIHLCYNKIRRIKRILHRLPLNVTCLEEAMTIRDYFLLSIKIPVYLGLHLKDGIQAHAWYGTKNHELFTTLN